MVKIHTSGFLPVPNNAPSPAKLRAIKKGSTVKVVQNAERFWTIVTKVDANGITAVVDNVLINKHPFKAGDLIRFKHDKVWDIYKKYPYKIERPYLKV